MEVRVARGATGVVAWLCLASAALMSAPARGYEAAIHQQLTFIAARHLNRCLEGTGTQRLAPLDVRYVARGAAAEAETGWFGWMFRSDFYDRAHQADKTFLWLFDARIHQRVRQSIADVDGADAAPARYAALGRVLAALQDMTSPAHVVPVYFARWWRLSVSDRFDGYPVDSDRIEASLEGDCSELLAPAEPSLEALMVDTASDTLRAVQRPIEGMPVSWQAFWTLAANPEDFGEYGPAGNNFGKRVEFECRNTRCVLLDQDPLYLAFALERHRLAVQTTAQALLWLQRRQEPVRATVAAQQDESKDQ